MIPEQEARRQNLPGADVFKWSELVYKDSLNRDSFVINLLNEAYRAFMLSNLVGNYELLMKEQEVNLEYTRALFPERSELPQYLCPLHLWQYENINLENLLISTGFEISARARLLSQDYLVQEIKEGDFRDLYKEQKTRPIHKDEFFAVSGYYYDKELGRNYLLGLHTKTVNYSLLFKDSYKQVLNLPDKVIEVAEEYRNLRNQIHFPGDAIGSVVLNNYTGDSLVRFIVSFINSEIVDLSNALIKLNEFNRSPLKRVTYFD
jgi:hypothetical protein